MSWIIGTMFVSGKRRIETGSMIELTAKSDAEEWAEGEAIRIAEGLALDWTKSSQKDDTWLIFNCNDGEIIAQVVIQAN